MNMEKPGFKYQMPDMTKVNSSRIDRARNLPDGEFLVEVYKFRPKVTRAQKLAVIGEFKILEIRHQEPSQDSKGNVIPPAVVGERRDHYYAFGEQYEYGEREWAQTMDALGIPVEERNSAQDAFLGEENLACGEKLVIRRQAPKTYFNPAQKTKAA
jgi:hypothetical protein